MNLKEYIQNLHKDESGQDLLEYALVLAVVLAAIVTGSDAVASVIGNGLTGLIGKIQNVVQ